MCVKEGIQCFCSGGSGKPEDSMEVLAGRGVRAQEGRERERRGSLKCDSQSRGGDWM